MAEPIMCPSVENVLSSEPTWEPKSQLRWPSGGQEGAV